MTTLRDLLCVHRDADHETLQWAFHQALVAAPSDPRPGDADPLLERVISNGILQDPKQRLIYCQLMACERERLQSKSWRVGVSHALTAALAVFLGVVACGYALWTPSPPKAIVVGAKGGDGVKTAAVDKNDDASLPPPVAPVPNRDVGPPTADNPAAAPAAVKGDENDPAAPTVVKRADGAPAAAPDAGKKADDAPGAAPAALKKDDDPPAAAPLVKKDDGAQVAAPVVKKADDTQTGDPAAAARTADTSTSAAVTAAEVPAATTPTGTVALPAAPRTEPPQDVAGADGATARPGGAATKGGDRAALGSPPGETTFRKQSIFYRDHGIASYRRGNFAQAVSDLNEAIRLNPDDAQAYNVRGNVKDETGDVEGALTDYDEAIRLDPTSGAAFDDRAILWRRKGELDKALADLDQAVRFNTADAKTYCDRGLIWYERGSIDQATADFNQAVKLDPNFAISYLRRGVVLHRNAEFKVALARAYRSIRVDPKILDASRRAARRAQPAAPATAPSETRAGPADSQGEPDVH